MPDISKNKRYLDHLRSSIASLSAAREEMERSFDRNMREEYDRICDALVKDVVELLKLGVEYSEFDGSVRIPLDEGKTVEISKKEILDTAGFEQYSVIFPEDDAVSIMGDNGDADGNIALSPYNFSSELGSPVAEGGSAMNPFVSFAVSYSNWMGQYIKRNDRMQAEIVSLKRKREDSERERDEAVKNTEKAKKELNAAVEESGRLKKEASSLREKLDAANREKDTLNIRVRDKDEYIDKLKKDLSADSEKIKVLEDSLGAIRDEKEKMTAANASSEKKLEGKNKRVGDLENEVKNLKGKIDRLNKELFDLNEVAYHDPKFPVYDVKMFNSIIFNGKINEIPVGFVDICGLKELNRIRENEEVGDRAIEVVLKALCDAFGENVVFRFRGGQFYVMGKEESLREKLDRIRMVLQEMELDIVFSCGTVHKERLNNDLFMLRAEAGKMYEAAYPKTGNIDLGKTDAIPMDSDKKVAKPEAREKVRVTAERQEKKKPVPEKAADTAPAMDSVTIDIAEMTHTDVKQETAQPEKKEESEPVPVPEPANKDDDGDVPRNPNVNLPVYREEKEDDNIKETDSTTFDLAEEIMQLAMSRQR